MVKTACLIFFKSHVHQLDKGDGASNYSSTGLYPLGEERDWNAVKKKKWMSGSQGTNIYYLKLINLTVKKVSPLESTFMHFMNCIQIIQLKRI